MEFLLLERSEIIIGIYDILGRCVYDTPIQEMNSGISRLNLNLKGLTSGQYFCILETPQSRGETKLLLLSSAQKLRILRVLN
jgi:hypothetical protein